MVYWSGPVYCLVVLSLVFGSLVCSVDSAVLFVYWSAVLVGIVQLSAVLFSVVQCPLMLYVLK